MSSSKANPLKRVVSNPATTTTTSAVKKPKLASIFNKPQASTSSSSSSSSASGSTSSSSSKTISTTTSTSSKLAPLASIFGKSSSSAITSTSSKTTTAIDATNFSRSIYQSSLSTIPKGSSTLSEFELLELESSEFGLDESWLLLLKDELKKNYFIKLKEFLWSEGMRGPMNSLKGKVYPEAHDVYAWSRHTPLHKCRVVIIGQDPYHDDKQAHGLCFSVKAPTRPPPSLKNIYKELVNEYPGFVPPNHGDLTPWATSGVLLLNTSLTVKPHLAASHSKKGWEDFTEKLVSLVDKYAGAEHVGEVGKGVVVMAWGAHAQKMVKGLSRSKHLILSSAHPSPLSAHRGFLGNDHFKLANEWLVKKYGEEAKIDWTAL